MKTLKLGRDFEMPAEKALTETFALLAVRGAGKSNAARVMAEEFFKASLPFVAIDPVGSWRGLRAARDGKGKGLAIPHAVPRRCLMPVPDALFRGPVICRNDEDSCLYCREQDGIDAEPDWGPPFLGCYAKDGCRCTVAGED